MVDDYVGNGKCFLSCNIAMSFLMCKDQSCHPNGIFNIILHPLVGFHKVNDHGLSFVIILGYYHTQQIPNDLVKLNYLCYYFSTIYFSLPILIYEYKIGNLVQEKEEKILCSKSQNIEFCVINGAVLDKLFLSGRTRFFSSVIKGSQTKSKVPFLFKFL